MLTQVPLHSSIWSGYVVMRSTCAFAITLQSTVPLVKLKTVGTKVGMWQDSLPAHIWLACPRFLQSVGVWLGATLLTPLVASLSQLSKVRLTKNSYIRYFKLGIYFPSYLDHLLQSQWSRGYCQFPVIHTEYKLVMLKERDQRCYVLKKHRAWVVRCLTSNQFRRRDGEGLDTTGFQAYWPPSQPVRSSDCPNLCISQTYKSHPR